MAEVTRLPKFGRERAKSFFVDQAAANTVTLSAEATERIVITHVYASPTAASTFTIDVGGVTLDFGDHPGTGDSIVFPDGAVLGDVGTDVVVVVTGATKMVVMGYIVE